jgi:hypothetical protein
VKIRNIVLQYIELYSILIVRIVNSRRQNVLDIPLGVGEVRNAHKILVENFVAKRTVARKRIMTFR